jgi:hypothetical protein
VAVAGDPGLWADFFPDGLIPEIIDLIFDAWATLTPPFDSEHEVPITRRLRAAIRRLKGQRLPFLVDRESWEDDLESGTALGRIDLRFTHGHREDVYFAFECKRLCVNFASGWQSLASEYTGPEGMMCFISGQYASSLRTGGMVGYVMDGDCQRAIELVDESIRRRTSELRIPTGRSFDPSSLRPARGDIKETTHLLQDRRFVMHHLFLARTVN